MIEEVMNLGNSDGKQVCTINFRNYSMYEFQYGGGPPQTKQCMDKRKGKRDKRKRDENKPKRTKEQREQREQRKENK